MTIMAKDEKKGGFFARFRKDEAPALPAVQAPVRNVVPTPESGNSEVSAQQPKASSVAPKPVVAPVSSEASVDTVEAFSRYCSSLVDIGTSQLKVIEMALGMLSDSLNKIVDGTKNKK